MTELLRPAYNHWSWPTLCNCGHSLLFIIVLGKPKTTKCYIWKKFLDFIFLYSFAVTCYSWKVFEIVEATLTCKGTCIFLNEHHLERVHIILRQQEIPYFWPKFKSVGSVVSVASVTHIWLRITPGSFLPILVPVQLSSRSNIMPLHLMEIKFRMPGIFSCLIIH